METPDKFKQAISDHLDKLAATDSLFAETLKKTSKNLDDCITYIVNTVQKIGRQGFADEEIYDMAIHYYKEDEIEVGKPMKGKVVVNHAVQLTEEEIQKAKSQAMEQVVAQERERLQRKSEKKKTNKEEVGQGNLFSL